MGLKGLLLEAKWQIYRPLIFLQYGWGYLVVDLYLDLRNREQERQDLQEGWKEIKTGLWKNDPYQVAGGQTQVQTVIYGILNEAIE